MPAGKHRELQPTHKIHGQGRNVDPGLIRLKIKERQLAKPGVLQGFDPVLTPAPPTVTGIQVGAVPARGVRQKRGDPGARQHPAK